jgi:hypothetical protein
MINMIWSVIPETSDVIWNVTNYHYALPTSNILIYQSHPNYYIINHILITIFQYLRRAEIDLVDTAQKKAAQDAADGVVHEGNFFQIHITLETQC